MHLLVPFPRGLWHGTGCWGRGWPERGTGKTAATPPPSSRSLEMLSGLASLRHNAAFTENLSNTIAKIRHRKHTPSVVHVFWLYLCEEAYKAVRTESCKWVDLGWVSLQADARPQNRAFVWHTLNPTPSVDNRCGKRPSNKQNHIYTQARAPFYPQLVEALNRRSLAFEAIRSYAPALEAGRRSFFSKRAVNVHDYDYSHNHIHNASSFLLLV